VFQYTLFRWFNRSQKWFVLLAQKIAMEALKCVKEALTESATVLKTCSSRQINIRGFSALRQTVAGSVMSRASPHVVCPDSGDASAHFVPSNYPEMKMIISQLFCRQELPPLVVLVLF
jgi:hypothetical protein